MLKKIACLFIFLMVVSTAIQSFYKYKATETSILSETQEEETNKESKELTYIYNSTAHHELIYAGLQKTQFALYNHLLNSDDYSSGVEFPPEKI